MIARMIVDGISGGDKKKPTEGFLDDDSQLKSADNYIGNTELYILIALQWAISIMLGVVAFWLSWTCNTALGYNIYLRAVFGAFAFFFGLTYIVLYIIMRWDVCKKYL